MWTIAILDCRGFQTHATTEAFLPHYSIGPDLSIPGQQKMEPGRRAYGNGFSLLDP
jgi:hypothetical protein